MSGDSTHKKIVNGYVVQVFAGVNCVEQVFIAGNPVDYVTMSDVPLEQKAIEHYNKFEVYQPFDMVQPVIEIDAKLSRRVRFTIALRNHFQRDPTTKEIETMMDDYMDYLEDFHDDCDLPDIQAALIKERLS